MRLVLERFAPDNNQDGSLTVLIHLTIHYPRWPCISTMVYSVNHDKYTYRQCLFIGISFVIISDNL